MADRTDYYDKLGLNAERVAGYVYSGLFFTISFALTFPTEVKTLVTALGGFLSSLSSIAVGFATFVFYRYLIGEYILFPAQHLFHRILDDLNNRTGEGVTSSVAYLINLGVTRGNSRDAYTAVRDIFLPESARRRFDLIHGEIHALFITAFGSFTIIGVSNLISVSVDGRFWLILGFITLIAAFISDTHQHSSETRLLKAFGKQKIKTFLKREGFL